MIAGVLFMTAPDINSLRNQISDDVAGSGVPLGGLLGGIASQVVPIQTQDLGCVKVAQIADGPVYIGILGRWVALPRY